MPAALDPAAASTPALPASSSPATLPTSSFHSSRARKPPWRHGCTALACASTLLLSACSNTATELFSPPAFVSASADAHLTQGDYLDPS
ncbi:hypothetical protein U9M48_011832 [Paspalum notatum var. saurae]|uniref:Uncharacterized protein n=1 Tax=Paspalum notatum var. saurae TaxID=547442 RepID=A0AAQ3SW77_PASNO